MPIGVAVATALFFSAQIVHAQSTVGELLDKGGKKLLKEDYAAMFPYAMKYWWPQGDGEGDLLVRADGTLSGTEYHYQSRSESAATGTWTLDDSGKLCVKKVLSAWNSKTDACWFGFRLGEDYFMGPQDADRSAKIFRVKSVAKQK